MSTATLFSLTLLALSFGLSGCEQTVKTETGSPTETGDTDDTDPGQGYIMEVTADGQTVSVDLSDLATVDFSGETLVPLQTVLDASSLKVDWKTRTYDFLASDGYRPSTNDCSPLDYTYVASGYFYPDSGNLIWDDTLGLAGCYYVDDTVKVDVQDAK